MNHRLLLFLFTVLFVTNIQGQSTSSLTDFINCIELKNGTDNLVLNGRPYLPTNPQANGHPYFQTKEWRAGLIYINGNAHPVDKLKYNLTTFQLVVKHQRPNGTSQKVVLSDLLVDSFHIDGHLFVNRKLVLADKESTGFLEKIFVDKLSFFRLQEKVFSASYNSDTPNGRFSNQKAVFYLLLNGEQYKITNKKKFLACFPNEKTQIKKYLKDHSLNWKKMSKIQFAQLLKFCNDQI